MNTEKVVEALESLRQNIEILCVQLLLDENPKPEPDWETIAGKGFLVGRSDISQKMAQKNANNKGLHILKGYDPDRTFPFETEYSDFKYIAFPELPGVRQPGFGKRPEWLMDSNRIMVKYAKEYTSTAFTVDRVSWYDVEEFILLP